MLRRLPLLVSALSLAALAGCVAGPPRAVMVAPAGPTGIEGEWASVGGPVAYTASFQSGRFTSREQATGAVLADGSYTKTNPTQASIVYTSRQQGQQVSVTCNQMAASRLACVNSAGNRFEFTRRA